jgi:hypothetical protein
MLTCIPGLMNEGGRIEFLCRQPLVRHSCNTSLSLSCGLFVHHHIISLHLDLTCLVLSHCMHSETLFVRDHGEAVSNLKIYNTLSEISLLASNHISVSDLLLFLPSCILLLLSLGRLIWNRSCISRVGPDCRTVLSFSLQQASRNGRGENACCPDAT